MTESEPRVVIDNPVSNSPFEEPGRYFCFTDDGVTNEVMGGRRPSAYFDLEGGSPVMSGDDGTTLAELRAIVCAFVHERDWEQFHNPKDLASAIAIEAAELMELFLWRDASEVIERVRQGPVRQQVEDELADVFILCLSLANRLEIDIAHAVRDKVRRNGEKYPTRLSRGRAHKYTEYATGAQDQGDSLG